MTPHQNPPIAFIHQLSDDEQQLWMDAFKKYCPDLNIQLFSELPKSSFATIEIAIVANPSTNQINQLINLKWLQSLWVGVENLLRSDLNPSIQIVKMSDPELANNMANSALTWSLFLQHQIPVYLNQQKNKIWLQHHNKPTERTQVSILGLGTLGTAAATKLIAHGFSVTGWSNSQKQIKGMDCLHGPEALKIVLNHADILINLLPLTENTKHLLNQQKLTWLPSNAAVINLSRGGVIDQQALIDALDRNHLSHAILDVFEIEPLAQENPLWSHPDITVLPHIAAKTNTHSATTIAAENIRKFLASGKLPQLVDKRLGY
jgi:glyoxylate/hydroxypyruvate reductase A